jgi:hypothetical protein
MPRANPFQLIEHFLARQQENAAARKAGTPAPDPIRYVMRAQAPKPGGYTDRPARWFVGKTVKLGIPTLRGNHEHLWFNHIRLTRQGHLLGTLAVIPLCLPFTRGTTKIGFDPEDVEEVATPAPPPRPRGREDACRDAEPYPNDPDAPRSHGAYPDPYRPAGLTRRMHSRP